MALFLWILRIAFILLAGLWAVPWIVVGSGVMVVSGPLGFLLGLFLLGVGMAPIGAILEGQVARRVGKQQGVEVRTLTREEFEDVYDTLGSDIEILMLKEREIE